MRPRIFSSDGRSSGWAACRARERSMAEWKVATTGSVEAHSAISDADGFSGSCRCSTSKRPASSQRLTRAVVAGPNVHPGDRAVVAHRHRATARGEVAGQRGVVVGGGQHGDVVAGAEEVLGEVAHVELHPAGHVPRVRADQADPHRTSPEVEVAAARRSRSRSSRKTRCSMCQSLVCSVIAAPSTSAQLWVIAVARSRVVPVVGTSTGGWKVIRIPQPFPRRSCRMETGCSGRLSASARAAGPGAIRAAWPHSSTSTPLAVRSRSASSG